MAKKPNIEVSKISELSGSDLHELCEAAETAIKDGGGFGWLKPPPRRVLENFWRGTLMVPERSLFIGRLDGVVVGSAQLVRPTKNNEAQAMAATLTTNFVVPRARGHGLARLLTATVEEHPVPSGMFPSRLACSATVEEHARRDGFLVLNLDVRATQEAAIALYEAAGYVRWATHPLYAFVDDNWLEGCFYYKDLRK